MVKKKAITKLTIDNISFCDTLSVTGSATRDLVEALVVMNVGQSVLVDRNGNLRYVASIMQYATGKKFRCKAESGKIRIGRIG